MVWYIQGCFTHNSFFHAPFLLPSELRPRRLLLALLPSDPVAVFTLEAASDLPSVLALRGSPRGGELAWNASSGRRCDDGDRRVLLLAATEFGITDASVASYGGIATNSKPWYALDRRTSTGWTRCNVQCKQSKQSTTFSADMHSRQLDLMPE